jgi:hypothetical protein
MDFPKEQGVDELHHVHQLLHSVLISLHIFMAVGSDFQEGNQGWGSVYKEI